MLLLERVRQALTDHPSVADPVIEFDGHASATVRAAVLFPIVLRDIPAVLLTQRTSHLRDHPGQISFPGGRIEPNDESPLAAALREAEEEVGLDRDRVASMGYLPDYLTGTGFRVTPVVSLVHPPINLRPDPFEVAEVFEVPLGFLLDASNYQRMTIHVGGAPRSFYSIPFHNRFIWGATAGMIRSLFDRMELAAGD